MGEEVIIAAKTLSVLGALVLSVFGLMGLAPAPALAAPEAPATPDASSIEITPNGISIAADGTQQFTATVYTLLGFPNPLAAVTWSIDPEAGTIVSTGALTAIVQVSTTAGHYIDALQATNGNLTGTASFTVTAGPLASIQVQPSVDTLTVGAQRQFTAAGFDAFGNPVPSFSAAWSVKPGAGSVVSSGPTSMQYRASTIPGLYTSAIRATSSGITGTANVLLEAGPPVSVVVTPNAATLSIDQTQAFEAEVYDAYGNPLNLGVTWLAQGGTSEPSGASSTVFRAGTVAGVYANGLIAAQGQIQSSVPITVLPGPAAALQIAANPPAIKTNGTDSSTIVASVVDAYGNATGSGAQVAFSLDPCAGTCEILPSSGAADAQGKVSATLRSTYISPTQPLSSQIKVTAQLQNGPVQASASTTIEGNFVPYKQMLPGLLRGAPIFNQTSCTALRLTPPETIVQAPSQAFNIYRFAAQASAHTVTLQNYAAQGQLLLYRVQSDRCAASNTLTLVYINTYPITSATQYQRVLSGLTPGAQYLLAVNTTSAFSQQNYALTVQ